MPRIYPPIAASGRGPDLPPVQIAAQAAVQMAAQASAQAVEDEMASAVPATSPPSEVTSSAVQAATSSLVDQVTFVDEASEDLGRFCKISDDVARLFQCCCNTLARFCCGADEATSALALRSMTKIYMRRRNALQEKQVAEEEAAERDKKDKGDKQDKKDKDKDKCQKEKEDKDKEKGKKEKKDKDKDKGDRNDKKDKKKKGRKRQ